MGQTSCYHLPWVAFLAVRTLLTWEVRSPSFLVSFTFSLSFSHWGSNFTLWSSLEASQSETFCVHSCPWSLEQCSQRNTPSISFYQIKLVFKGKYKPRDTNLSIVIAFLITWCGCLRPEGPLPSRRRWEGTKEVKGKETPSCHISKMFEGDRKTHPQSLCSEETNDLLSPSLSSMHFSHSGHHGFFHFISVHSKLHCRLAK